MLRKTSKSPNEILKTGREKVRNFLMDSPLWTVGPGLDLFLDLKDGPQGLIHLLGKSGGLAGWA